MRLSVVALSRILRALRASCRVDSVAAKEVKANNSISIAAAEALIVRNWKAVEFMVPCAFCSHSGVRRLKNWFSSGE
jgi:hypothetical protein